MNAEHLNSNEDEVIELGKTFIAIWNGRLIIVVSTIIFTLAAVMYALSLPNIYKSEASLTLANQNAGGGLSALTSQYQGIASLAGISLPSGGTDDRSVTLVSLQSRDFFAELYKDEAFIKQLWAYSSVSGDSGKIDPQIYGKNGWNKERFPAGAPTLLDSFDQFRGAHLKVNDDFSTGLIFVSIEHEDPSIAFSWLNKFVREFNEFTRSKELRRAQKKVDFLSERLIEEDNVELRRIISELLQQEFQVLSLANISDEFSLEVVDSPRIPTKRSKPYRSYIVAMGAALGVLLSLFFLLVVNFSGLSLATNLFPPKAKLQSKTR